MYYEKRKKLKFSSEISSNDYIFSLSLCYLCFAQNLFDNYEVRKPRFWNLARYFKFQNIIWV